MVILAESLGLAAAGPPAGARPAARELPLSTALRGRTPGAADAVRADPPLVGSLDDAGAPFLFSHSCLVLALSLLNGAGGDHARTARRGRGDDQPGKRALQGVIRTTLKKINAKGRADRRDRRGERARRGRSDLCRLVGSRRAVRSRPGSSATQEEGTALRGVLARIKFLVHLPLPPVLAFVLCSSAIRPGRRSSSQCRYSRSSGSAPTRKIAGSFFAGFGAWCSDREFPVVTEHLLQRIYGLRLIALSVPLQAVLLWLLTLHLGARCHVPRGAHEWDREIGICNPTIHRLFTLLTPARKRCRQLTVNWGPRVAPLGLLLEGPVLAAIGPQPVLGRLRPRAPGVQARRLRGLPSCARGGDQRPCSSWFAFAVSATDPACRKSFAAAAPSDHPQPPEARREDLRCRQAGGRPTRRRSGCRSRARRSPVPHAAVDGLFVFGHCRPPRGRTAPRSELVTCSRDRVRAA